MKLHIKKIYILIVGIAMLYSCNKKDDVVVYPSLDTYLKSRPDLSLFAQTLEKAQLQSFQNGPGPFTWLIPNNDAFAAANINADSINRMTSGTASYLLVYHLINARFTSQDMLAQNSFPRATQLGPQVFFAKNEVGFFVNGSKVITSDIELINGIVHIIDKFNVAPALSGTVQTILSKTGQHTLFIEALIRAGRWNALNTSSVFTIVAPTNAAMTAAGLSSVEIAAMPVPRVDSIVRYHYFNGVRLFSNDFGNRETPQTALGASRTITSLSNGKQLKGTNNLLPVNFLFNNRLGTNGVVHSIDGVLKY